MKKKNSPPESIEESLERISKSLSVIAGILDILMMEYLKEKGFEHGPPVPKTTPFSEENLRNKNK
jgi:hypothetical protein